MKKYAYAGERVLHNRKLWKVRYTIRAPREGVQLARHGEGQVQVALTLTGADWTAKRWNPSLRQWE